MKKLITIFIVAMFGCNETDYSKQPAAVSAVPVAYPVVPNMVVSSANSSLQLVNGVWYYRQQLFNGWLETYFPSGSVKARQPFFNGKEEGLVSTFYENGNKDARRFYHNGEKDSINMGWWINGTPRFEYHFKNGIYEGDFKEWYVSGKPLKHIIYHNGKEQSGTGWRENGKVYMSFVTRNGRLYGLINPNLCYSLKNERGEYVATTK